MAAPAAVVYNAAGLFLNNAQGTVDLALAHNFNNSRWRVLGQANALNGTVDYSVQILKMVSLALHRKNSANAAELDAILHGIHGLDFPAIFNSLAVAENAGFVHGVIATGNTLEDGFSIVRAALEWAPQNVNALRVLMAADFYVLPPMAGGANPTRVRMSYSLLIDSTGLFSAATELIGLLGDIHDAASRNNNSRYAQGWDLIIDKLGDPPLQQQPMSMARVMMRSGLPPQLAVYPHNMADYMGCIMLRLSYVGGSYSERRSAFIVYLPLLVRAVPTLQLFLQPYLTPDQGAEAYISMAQRIYRSTHPPSEQTVFHLTSSNSLAALLQEMPEVPAKANNMTPIGDASYRSLEAVSEWDRRRMLAVNSNQGGLVANNEDGSIAGVNASRSKRVELSSKLLPLPFFGAADGDLVRLKSMAPTNEFPLIKRALETRNVIFFQVAVGKLKGVADVSAGLGYLQAAASKFTKYVDNCTVMDKAPAPVPGTRPPHTLSYNQEPFTVKFLSNDQGTILKLDFLEICTSIKSAREKIMKPAYDKGSGIPTIAEYAELRQYFTHLAFESLENIALLRYFSHYLDAFEFKMTGDGSWHEAIDRIERFRGVGNSMPGQSHTYHLANCQKAFMLLLRDLQEAVEHYAQNQEAADVSRILTDRVYEVGGAFDRHLSHQNTGTSQLNDMLLLNPGFAAVMGGKAASSSSDPPDEEKGHTTGQGGGKGKFQSASGKKFKWENEFLYFGKAGQVGKDGTCYNTKLIWEAIKKVQPNAKSANFCMLQFLARQQMCTIPMHKGKIHSISKAVKQLRESFEAKPYRVDAKAKEA